MRWQGGTQCRQPTTGQSGGASPEGTRLCTDHSQHSPARSHQGLAGTARGARAHSGRTGQRRHRSPGKREETIQAQGHSSGSFTPDTRLLFSRGSAAGSEFINFNGPPSQHAHTQPEEVGTTSFDVIQICQSGTTTTTTNVLIDKDSIQALGKGLHTPRVPAARRDEAGALLALRHWRPSWATWQDPTSK